MQETRWRFASRSNRRYRLAGPGTSCSSATAGRRTAISTRASRKRCCLCHRMGIRLITRRPRRLRTTPYIAATRAIGRSITPVTSHRRPTGRRSDSNQNHNDLTRSDGIPLVLRGSGRQALPCDRLHYFAEPVELGQSCVEVRGYSYALEFLVNDGCDEYVVLFE